MQDFIRYARLTFTIIFTTSAPIPAYKGSTLRGGMGDVLLNEHCIADAGCRRCSFRDACVVPNIFYHPLKIVPDCVHDGGSLGFTVECLDDRTYARKGTRMQFSLLLYGDVIVYFTTILDAVYRLGLIGIGPKKQARFEVVSVQDQDGNRLLDNGSVNPRAIHVRNLMEDAIGMAERAITGKAVTHEAITTQGSVGYEAASYVGFSEAGSITLHDLENKLPGAVSRRNPEQYRRIQVSQEQGIPEQDSQKQYSRIQGSQREDKQIYYDLTIRFLSPWSQKWQNAFLVDFNMIAFTDSVCRRVYLMYCMEGIRKEEGCLSHLEFDLSETYSETLELASRSTTRYSNRQETHIHLKGIQGSFRLIHVPEELLPFIFAGEIVHIGKNTSIGYGKYTVMDIRTYGKE